jgi:hypothetical protein
MDGGGGGVISGQSARMFFRGREAGRASWTLPQNLIDEARALADGRPDLQRSGHNAGVP